MEYRWGYMENKWIHGYATTGLAGIARMFYKVLVTRTFKRF